MIQKLLALPPRNLLWLIPLIMLLLFPVWRIPVAAFLAPRGGYDPALAQNRPDAHDFTMNTVHITQSHNGQTTLVVSSQQAMTGASVDEFKMDDIHATIFDDRGKPTLITAQHGIFNKNSSELSLIDSVVIKKPADKYEIYTELLHYNDKSKMAHCPGATRLVGETVSIKGGSLEYDTVSKRYDIGGRVLCSLTSFARP